MTDKVKTSQMVMYKKYFSEQYNVPIDNIDVKYVYSVKNGDLHRKLNLNPGFVSPMPAIINLLIMCTGINSRCTIKEVLRGYFGDKYAKSLFSFDEEINIVQPITILDIIYF